MLHDLRGLTFIRFREIFRFISDQPGERQPGFQHEPVLDKPIHVQNMG